MLRNVAERPMAQVDRCIDLAIIAGVAVLVLVGFITSYHTLLDLSVAVGGYPPWLAPAVPLSFDLGIIVLSLKVAQAAREGRHAPVLRLLVISLSAATIAANATAAPGLAGRVLHAVPPAMFVVCFESVVITARRHALQTRGLLPEPVPRQHPLRWLLAPRTTWLAWRSAVLHGAVPTVSAPAMPLAPQPGKVLPATPVHRESRATPSAPQELVAAALRDDGDLAAPSLRLMLAQHGVNLSLRTVQRLRAAAVRDRRP